MEFYCQLYLNRDDVIAQPCFNDKKGLFSQRNTGNIISISNFRKLSPLIDTALSDNIHQWNRSILVRFVATVDTFLSSSVYVWDSLVPIGRGSVFP